ncbi:hypothetical protein ACFT5B_15000 [Luteimicrobium sp. NPDC057192]|uniref:hypothetical protein n=1 Tax=Luteimicrobium sp. NPDC057192 TaxID=3346042 RepID=UPI003641E99D
MKVLFDIFLILHFVGWAIVLGGYLTSMRKPGLPVGVFHGAATAVVAGLVMMGIYESNKDVLNYELSQAALGAKLVFALIVAVLAFVAQRKKEQTPAWVKHGVGVLVLVNIVIAVFWL